MKITCFGFCNPEATGDHSEGGHGGVLGSEAHAVSLRVNVRRGSGNRGHGNSCEQPIWQENSHRVGAGVGAG